MFKFFRSFRLFSVWGGGCCRFVVCVFIDGGGEFFYYLVDVILWERFVSGCLWEGGVLFGLVLGLVDLELF